MTDDTGQIRTVTGPIDPADLGVTLPHEHVFFDAVDAWYEPPDSAVERTIAEAPVTLENLWWIRHNPFNHRANLRAGSVDDARDGLERFLRHGGDAVVDVTPRNVGGDPQRVRGLARRTGVTIVHGTGFYTKSAHPDGLADRPLDEIRDALIDDVRNGIGDTDVQAGIIGEIGLSGQIDPEEERVLRASAQAAAATGSPLTVHPPGKTRASQRDRTYPSSRWGLEILDVVEEEGLAPERVVIGHLDRSLYEDLDYQRRLADRGAYLEYDLWGTSEYLPQFDDGYPGDAWRVDAITQLVDDGYRDRLLLSQDVASNVSRRKYGGPGYSHVLETAIPRLRAAGLTPDDVRTLLVRNPRRLLTVVESES